MAKKKTSKRTSRKAPTGEPASEARPEVEAPSSTAVARTEETSEGELPGNKVADGSGELDEPAADPADEERRARLAQARVPCTTCPIFGIPLEASTGGPKSAARYRGRWMSALAVWVLRDGVTAEQLDAAAAWVREAESA